MGLNKNIFDISKVNFDDNGIKNFYWPIQTQKSSLVFNYLKRELVPFVNDYKDDHLEVEAIKIFMKWFIVDILKLLDATILYQGIKKDADKPLIPKNYRYIDALLNCDKIECLTFISRINRGIKIPYKIKNFLRQVKWNFGISGFEFNFFKTKYVKSFEYNYLIKEHAIARKLKLKSLTFSQFFIDIKQRDITEKKNYLLKIDEIIRIIERSYHEVDCILLDKVDKYIREWLNQAVNFYQLHREQIEKSNLFLSNDKEVWLGCGGSTIYNAVVIEVLRQKKIKVVTHDHGSGNAHHDQTLVHWTEFIYSDYFVQFNPIISKIRRDSLNKKLLLGNNEPVIVDINHIRKSKKTYSNSIILNIKNEIKNISYVSTAFHGEGQRMRPIIHDMTYYDWQIKLISHLKKNNFNVLYKDHPESPTKLPKKFYNNFHLKQSNKKFENINLNTDMYIIDFIFSSTTPKILQSRIPVIFIDLGFPEIKEEALELVKKRCYYLKAKYDNQSRLDIDWRQLDKYLNREIHNLDMSFPDLYFENCS